MNRKVKVILGIVGGLAVISAITVAVLQVTKSKEAYELQLLTKDSEIASLSAQLQEIGPIATTYQLAYDVKSGTIIEPSDLVGVDIPEKYTYDEDVRKTGYITNINDIVGQRYKTDLSEGTILTPALVYPNDLTGDLRYLDIVFDELPIGIEVGDYVDVRFQFPLGQDFIAMTHKEIVAINDHVMKLVVSQADVYVYESIKTDKAYYPGTKLYGIQYIDGGIQRSVENYYPIRLETLTAMVQDPNLGDDFDMTKYQYVDRDLLEEQLISNIDANTNPLYREYIDLINENKTVLEQQYNRALEAYESGQTGSGSSGGGSSTEVYGGPVYN